MTRQAEPPPPAVAGVLLILMPTITNTHTDIKILSHSVECLVPQSIKSGLKPPNWYEGMHARLEKH